MASFREYLIDERERADVYLYWDCKYQLDGDELLSVERTEAWCYACKVTVASEKVPSLAELDARIAGLDNPDNLILKAFGRAALERERAELPIRRAWRAARQSAARCLECGSTDIFPLADDDCVEPRHNKRFRTTSGGHASMCFEIVRRLSTEGEVIYTDDPAKSIKFG